MRPLTAERPKVLLPVAGVPMLERLVRQFAAAGIGRFTIVTAYRAEKVREALGDGRAIGPKVRIDYVDQGEPRGTGHAATVGLGASGIKDEPFLIANGDIVLDDADVARLMAGAADGGAVGTARAADPTRFGVFRMDATGAHPVEIVEKSERPPSEWINAGVYAIPKGADFAADLAQLAVSSRGEYEITDAMTRAFRRGLRVRMVEFAGWQDVGRPWDLLVANERLLRTLVSANAGTIEPGATLHGAVHVGAGTRIRAGSYLEGPVWIGAEASIGPNCYIRPYTVIGRGVRVGNGCEVKASLLMDGTHVGHLSYVGDSVLGAGVNLGAGTKVANLRHDGKSVRVEWEGQRVDTGRRKMGVILGDGVHTGINTSLNAGVVLAAHATTLPGEVVMKSRST
jgi:bifunctional UDP-N-acetylglucosamine pyrophosphorylase/glucosamine-1-phosphate N-acetyltransferase